MIIDTSAIMAVLLDEAEAKTFTGALFENSDRRISAGTWIELAAVLTRRQKPELTNRLETLVRYVRFQIIPVSVRQAEIGHAAYREFGRGSGHRAELNLGDCFAYALAKESGEPLLYKGDDFAETDVASAL